MTKVAPYPMKMNRRRSSSWEEVVEGPQARCCTLAKSYRGWLRFFNAVFLVTGLAIIGFMFTLRFLSASTGINPGYAPDMASFVLGSSIGGFLVLIALAGSYAGKGSKCGQYTYAALTLLSLGCVIAIAIIMAGWRETEDVATKELDLVDNLMRGKSELRRCGRVWAAGLLFWRFLSFRC